MSEHSYEWFCQKMKRGSMENLQDLTIFKKESPQLYAQYRKKYLQAEAEKDGLMTAADYWWR